MHISLLFLLPLIAYPLSPYSLPLTSYPLLFTPKDYAKAFQVISDRLGDGWQVSVMELADACPPSDATVSTLRACGDLLVSKGEEDLARTVFQKLGDVAKILDLLIRKQLWDEAVTLAERHLTDETDGEGEGIGIGEGRREKVVVDKGKVYTPYAEWLVSKDRFDDALTAFRKAGNLNVVSSMLLAMAKNAITECR